MYVEKRTSLDTLLQKLDIWFYFTSFTHFMSESLTYLAIATDFGASPTIYQLLLINHITYIACIVSSHFSDLIFFITGNGRVVLAFWYRGTLQIPIHYFHPFTAQSRDHDSRCRFDLIHVITMSFWFDSLHFCFLCSVAVC
jgi:type III secretory pathway component EscT